MLARPGAGGGLVGLEGPNLLKEALRAGLRGGVRVCGAGSGGLVEEMNLPGRLRCCWCRRRCSTRR